MNVSTGDIVSRVYGNFRGVDFRGEEINIRRSPDSLNVWKDYRKTESIRTRPGMKRLYTSSGLLSSVSSISYYKGLVIAHVGTELIEMTYSGKVLKTIAQVSYGRGNSFVYNGIFYYLDGFDKYIQYDGNEAKEVEGYVPTTSIGRRPSGGGTIHEDVNMLSPYRINTFLADGKSNTYFLDVQNIDSDVTPEITVNGEIYPMNNRDNTSNWFVDYEQGIIDFLGNPPPAPDTDGQDNVKIKFKKTKSTDADGNTINIYEKYRQSIIKCKLLQVFDNRVFVSGNYNYPNYVWHCSLDDPTYFSDLDYYREGMDEAKINGMVAGNNALWVFREPSDSNTNVFYHTPTIDAEYGKIYPSSHSSITIGCRGKAINFNDDIVFFSERGMEGISGDITTEQAVAHRSSLVDRKMIAENNYSSMILEEWEGYLLVITDSRVYLADSRTAFSNEGHIEYDWFYWELSHKINCTRVILGTLFLGTDDGIYTMSALTKENGAYTQQTDDGANFESYWVTPKDKFNSAHKLKTTNKRGCTVEAEGDISVYVKTEDTEFELVGTYENITDYFVSRIKRKKWKDIQLKFHSNTRFSLETATLEAFIGGYIKR